MGTLNASWRLHFLIPRMRKLGSSIEGVEEQGCGETSGLGYELVLQLLTDDFTQGRTWTWARENWDWVKKALGGDMSFDKFVIYPANCFKTRERLNEYKAFLSLNCLIWLSAETSAWVSRRSQRVWI